jgi:multidrug transporter EmrE-like cation transporter
MPPPPPAAASTLINFGLVLLGVVLNTAAQVALKLATTQFRQEGQEQLGLGTMLHDPLRFVGNPWIILGCVLYVASVVNWLIVLSRWELSVAYALMSMAYILTFVVGVWKFDEPVSAVRITGLVVIVLGVILITRPVPTPHG